MKNLLYILVLSILAGLFFLLPHQNAGAQEELFVNGSFETGDFTGWTVVQEANSGGDWFVYSGNLAPISGLLIMPPPDGTFAAVTDQSGPGSQVLFQDIVVPAQGTVGCSAIVYYENPAGVFIIGPDLSSDGPLNQQARIDIMDPDAPDFDIGAGVLENLFQTNPGDPNSLGYTTVNFDLTDFAGTTVRLRAAEVDNTGELNFSIDNVTCVAANIVRNIPTLSEWGLIAMAAILGIAGFMVIRRRQAAA